MMLDTQSRLRRGPAAYHNVATSHFRIARFSEPLFRSAVEHLVDRHEIFRTTLHIAGFSEPIAIVHASRPARLEVTDLRDLSPHEQTDQIATFQSDQNAQVVDLTDAPLIRFSVHICTDHEIKLTLVEPHAISDGWSTHLTLGELLTNYDRLLTGSGATWSPVRTEYRQFIAHERAAVTDAAHRLFWQVFLAHASGTMLPSRGGRAGPFEHKRYRELDSILVDAVVNVARAEGLPLRTVVLAAHVKTLSVLTGADDIVAGVTFNGRLEVPDGAEIRGMFLNTLPLRFERLGVTWRQLLRCVYATESVVVPFRRYPLAEILRVVGQHVRPQTLFSYHHFHSLGDSRAHEVVDTMESVTDDSRTNVPFEVAVIRSAERDNALTLLVDVDPTMFSSGDVELFEQTYLRVLSAITQNLEASHHRFSGHSSGGGSPAEGLSVNGARRE